MYGILIACFWIWPFTYRLFTAHPADQGPYDWKLLNSVAGSPQWGNKDVIGCSWIQDRPGDRGNLTKSLSRCHTRAAWFEWVSHQPKWASEWARDLGSPKNLTCSHQGHCQCCCANKSYPCPIHSSWWDCCIQYPWVMPPLNVPSAPWKELNRLPAHSLDRSD